MCVRMLGKSHTDPDARPFAMQVMQKLNDKCQNGGQLKISAIRYMEHDGITTYKFAKCLQKRFGIIKGVTDKNILRTVIMYMYQSRSMHSRN